MTQAQGYKGQLVVDFEVDFGETPVTPHGIKMPFNSAQLKSKQNLIDSNTITGRRDPAEPLKGNIDVSGALVVPVDEVAIGYWLKAMFGNLTTSGTGAPYTHVFKPDGGQPSLVIEEGFTDIGVYQKFNGCKIAKFGLNLGGDAELTANIDVLGAIETVGAVSFDNDPTEIDLARFNNFQASIEEGGSRIGIVTNAALDVEFGLAGDMYAVGGNGTRSNIVEGIIKITGNIKAFFENQVLLNKALQSLESSLLLKLASGQHGLEIFLPEIIYERNSPGIEGSKGVLIDLPFRAYYANNGQNAAIIATLKNGQAIY